MATLTPMEKTLVWIEDHIATDGFFPDEHVQALYEVLRKHKPELAVYHQDGFFDIVLMNSEVLDECFIVEPGFVSALDATNWVNDNLHYQPSLIDSKRTDEVR